MKNCEKYTTAELKAAGRFKVAPCLAERLTKPVPSQLLRLPAVIELTGLSKTTIYTLKDFPRPIKLGSRCSAFVRDEILAWISERIAARDEAHANTQTRKSSVTE